MTSSLAQQLAHASNVGAEFTPPQIKRKPRTPYERFLAERAQRTDIVDRGRRVDDSEMHESLFGFQREAVRWAARRGRVGLFADCGLGKAQPLDEPVLTPSGWRMMADIAVGDQVISVGGEPTTVIGVHPQGIRPIMLVTFNDGATVRCDEQHLWTVTTDTDMTRGNAWRVMSTIELAESDLTKRPRYWEPRWRVPVSAAVEHSHIEFPVHPYVMGVLLGDGTFRRQGIEFTSADPEIAANVKERLPGGMTVSLYKTVHGAGIYGVVLDGPSNPRRRNPHLAAFKEWGIHGLKSYEKFVPAEYLTGSIAQRLDLIRGLMDTDGYVSATGTIQFGSSSPGLASSMQSLVRSLGGIARMTQKIPTYVYNNERRHGKPHYTLTIAMPDGIIPFYLKRKVERCKDRYYIPQRKISTIEYIGSAECVCISVEHSSSLYVTNDYVVTHNSRMQLTWAHLVADRALLVAPLSVARQTVREAEAIGLDLRYVRSGSKASGPGLWITNYEMVDQFDLSTFNALVLDESSILKHVDSKTRLALSEAARTVPLRLACTATPAPNDVTEIVNHADFLGVMPRAAVLATYFVNIGQRDKADYGWRLKGHAHQDFYRWMAGWAMPIRTPGDLGYSDEGYNLPPLVVTPEIVECGTTVAELGGITGRSTMRRRTLKARVDRAVEIVNRHPEDQHIVWCGLNDEASFIAEALGDRAANVEGSWAPDRKAEALEAFQDGEIMVLVTKPKIAGFGMNFQNAHRMTFCGIGDSWESYFQAIRREWRFGQHHPVDVSIVVSEAEATIVDNVMRKEAQAKSMTAQLVAAAQEMRMETR